MSATECKLIILSELVITLKNSAYCLHISPKILQRMPLHYITMPIDTSRMLDWRNGKTDPQPCQLYPYTDQTSISGNNYRSRGQ